ncbi:MAG: response regulator, partial [Marinilabiliales bacterium]
LIVCGSGEDTLDKVNNILKDKFNIDFVLMDINLPGEYNGITLMHKLKNDFDIFTKIPFIAQTAYAMSNERDKLINEGFDEYLSKPIKKTELENVVQKVLVL